MRCTAPLRGNGMTVMVGIRFGTVNLALEQAGEGKDWPRALQRARGIRRCRRL